jgi:hypothetical protein
MDVPVPAGIFFKTELPLDVTTARESEVIIKTTATTVVILLRNDAEPRLPKSVWLDPPKAAPISAPLPLWSSTTAMRKRQAKIWIIINSIVMVPS